MNSHSVRARNKAPLRLTLNQLDVADSFLRQIEAELERAEKLCTVTVCHVTLEPAAQRGIQATVSLHVDGARACGAMCWGPDPLAAMRDAFTAVRVELEDVKRAA